MEGEGIESSSDDTITYPTTLLDAELAPMGLLRMRPPNPPPLPLPLPLPPPPPPPPLPPPLPPPPPPPRFTAADEGGEGGAILGVKPSREEPETLALWGRDRWSF
jgi:hypothetical protein